METRYILWTGGWDSTYRMVELSRQELTVQPVYVIDDGRKSAEKEKEVMADILHALREHPQTKATLMDVKYIPKQEIPANEAITLAYRKVRQEQSLGGQYDWLARLAVQYPGIELGVEKPLGQGGGCNTLIARCGKLREQDGIYCIDRENSSRECVLLLGNFTFPIRGKTVVDMIDTVARWGYEDIMKKIWFCNAPIGGCVCGMCNPCRQKMEGGMDWLLPEAAQKRYRTHTKIRKLFGVKVGEAYRRLRCRGKQ